MMSPRRAFPSGWLMLLLAGILGGEMMLAVRSDQSLYDKPICEPIKIDMCKMIGYNLTGMPNLVGQNLQSDAKFELETYTLLIQSRCSNELHFFLCSAYVPMCLSQPSNTPQVLIGPCRKLCERVRDKCVTRLQEIGLNWPFKMECSKFPESNTHYHMCMEGPGPNNQDVPLQLGPSSLQNLQANPLFMEKLKQHVAEGSKCSSCKSYIQLLQTNFDKQSPAQGVNVECASLKKSSQYQFVARLNRCVPLCQSDIIFSAEDKALAHIWISAGAASGLFFALFTLVSLILDSHGPCRSVAHLTRNSALFLTLSSCGYCAAFILTRFFASQDLCLASDQDENVSLLALEGHRSQSCAIIFLLVYFFTNALSHWFTVTSLIWALATSRALASASVKLVSTMSTMCHVYGWGIPATLTISAIVSHQVEAEEFSSLCYPGASHNDFSYFLFIVLPQAIQLALGVTFFLVGLAYTLFKMNEKVVVTVRTKPAEVLLKKFTMNFIIFGIIYILSMGCILGIHVHTYSSRRLWLESSNSTLPDSQLFILRLFMGFFITICTFSLVFYKDTIVVWQQCCRRRSSCLRRWEDKTADLGQVAYHPQAVVDQQVHLLSGHRFATPQAL